MGILNQLNHMILLAYENYSSVFIKYGVSEYSWNEDFTNSENVIPFPLLPPLFLTVRYSTSSNDKNNADSKPWCR